MKKGIGLLWDYTPKDEGILSAKRAEVDEGIMNRTPLADGTSCAASGSEMDRAASTVDAAMDFSIVSFMLASVS